MQNYFFVKSGKTCFKVRFADIYYVEAVKRYTKIVTSHKKYLLLAPIGAIAKHLPGEIFCRIHKSFLISLDHLSDFEHEIAHVAGHALPIGRGYRSTLSGKLIMLCDAKNEKNLTDKDIEALLKNIPRN